MKKVILMPVLLLLCVTLFAVAATAIEPLPNEFRGIPFGAEASKENLKKWKLIEHIKFKEITIYLRDGEKDASFEGVRISAPIQYHFFDGKGFVCAIAGFKGQANYERVQEMCIKNWGEPKLKTEVDKGTEYDNDMLFSLWYGFDMALATTYAFNEAEDSGLVLGRREYLQK